MNTRISGNFTFSGNSRMLLLAELGTMEKAIIPEKRTPKNSFHEIHEKKNEVGISLKL